MMKSVKFRKFRMRMHGNVNDWWEHCYTYTSGGALVVLALLSLTKDSWVQRAWMEKTMGRERRGNGEGGMRSLSLYLSLLVVTLATLLKFHKSLRRSRKWLPGFGMLSLVAAVITGFSAACFIHLPLSLSALLLFLSPSSSLFSPSFLTPASSKCILWKIFFVSLFFFFWQPCLCYLTPSTPSAM